MSNAMVSPQTESNVSDVVAVAEPTSGNSPTIRPIANDIGSSSGSLRAIQSDSCPAYPATAKINLNASKITGSIKSLLNQKNHFVAITYYSTALTFTNKDVSWS